MNHKLIILLFLAIAVCLMSAGVGAADDVDVTFEGHIGGATDVVAVSGNFAYIGQSQDFVVFDISNPEAPSELGKLVTDSLIRGVAVSGSYAYVADSNDGLVVVDISNPAAPTLAGSYDTEIAWDVAVSGNYAYVADSNDGLVVVDISNPAAPTLAGSYDVGRARGVAVSGNYAYVATDSIGLVVVDITNPAVPTLAGNYDTIGSARDVAVSGSYAYVGDGNNGLLIIDISNPAAPTLTGSYDTAGYARDVAISGSYAYVADHGDLVIIDISNPVAPTLAGRYDTAVSARGVAVSSSYAYVANFNDFVIIDISNPAAPTLAGSYDTALENTFGVAVSGNYAYVADYYALVIIDISNPEALSELGKLVTDSLIRGVAVSGNYAYVADSSNGLLIIDISNPAAPTLAGRYDTAGYAQDVAVSGSYAYVADSNDGLLIIDISNPAAPTLAGIYDTAGYAQDVAVSGSYAYVGDGNNGLLIIDISNPAAPTLTGSYDTAGSARDVAISGSYAYVADYERGLAIIDISNPVAPTLAGSYDTGSAFGVAVSGSYAHVADNYNGLLIIDISNPAAPTLAGSYDTAGYARDVAISGSYAYVADSSNGLMILSTNIPPQASIQDKSLLRVEGQPEVYWLQNGKLYWVTDWDVINQMSGIPGWDSVNTLSESEFDPMNYNWGPMFITPGLESDGLLIRDNWYDEYYLILDGMKHRFTSIDAILESEYNLDDVIDVNTNTAQMISSGSDIDTGLFSYDLKVKSIHINPETLVVDDEISVNIVVENVGQQDINLVNHDLYIRMIAGYKFGNYNVLQEEQFSDQLSIQIGETQTISKTFIMTDDDKHELLFMVDAVEVEIISNEYQDSDILNNRLIKDNILTLISLNDQANCLFSAVIGLISVNGVPLSDLNTFLESDQELMNSMGSLQSAAINEPIDALNMYADFIIRLIELIRIENSIDFAYNFAKNTIVGAFELGKCSGYNIIQLTNIVYQIQDEITINIKTNIFRVESPVDIEIINDNSQSAGYVNGNVVTDIGDSYVIVDGSIKTVVIFDNADTNYIIKLTGTGDGTFNFYISSPKDEILREYKDIPVNTGSIGILETENYILNIDFDGDGNIDQIIPPTETYQYGDTSSPTGSEIPEFPSVILPVTGILVTFAILSRRKGE